MASAGIQIDGVIETGKVYPINTFRTLTGLGAGAMREARKKGLTVRKVGLRSYVLGADFLEFVEKHGKPIS